VKAFFKREIQGDDSRPTGSGLARFVVMMMQSSRGFHVAAWTAVMDSRSLGSSDIAPARAAALNVSLG
jgi:hypothetical protein